jgi:pimeloyl-ACP methyl ester carboxylesterase
MHSVYDPDPSLLVWDKRPTPGEYTEGWLKVSLDPDDNQSPELKLRVKMLFAEQNTTKPPVFHHCGGPGSGRECFGGWLVNHYADSIFDVRYHHWSIDQRGIGDSRPNLACKGNAKLPDVVQGKRYEISDFTNCPCALPDGTPMISEAWADVDPANRSQVQHLFQRMAPRADPTGTCFQSPKFQLVSKKNGNTYNFLNYVGTQMLARDMDVFRKSICSSRISIHGMSYGTAVGAAYASVFPDNVEHVVLDGNMDSHPSKLVVATGASSGLMRATAKLLYDCSWEPDCRLKHPTETFAAILDDARAGKLKSRAGSFPSFPVSVGMLLAYIQAKLNDGGTWVPAIDALTRLAPTSTDDVRSEMVEKILDEFCVLNGVPTWRKYGICVGEPHVAEGHKSFMPQTAVLGSDLAGRLTLDDAMRAWETRLAEYGHYTTAFLGIFAGVNFWPAVPSPIAPFGNPKVPALVIGNLYDGSTEYQWSQAMHNAFPSGSMMTWQGGGHLLSLAFLFGRAPYHTCYKYVMECFVLGLLPPNGHVCRVSNTMVTDPVAHASP